MVAALETISWNSNRLHTCSIGEGVVQEDLRLLL